MLNTVGAERKVPISNPDTISLSDTQPPSCAAIAGVTIIIALSSATIHTKYIVFILFTS
jgi:hypothetical protein